MTLFLLFLACIRPLATWERGLLQTSVMQPTQYPQADAFEAHALDSREAMAGGGGGGIPCGCN